MTSEKQHKVGPVANAFIGVFAATVSTTIILSIMSILASAAKIGFKEGLKGE